MDPLQGVVEAVARQVDDELLKTGVVADQQQRLNLGGHLVHDLQEFGHVGSVEARVVPDRWRGAPLGGGEVPGLTGADGGGAQREVGQEVGLDERAARGGCVPAAARGQWALVVGDALGPGGLGVPQHDQAAQRARSGARDHARVPSSRVSSRPSSRSA